MSAASKRTREPGPKNYLFKTNPKTESKFYIATIEDYVELLGLIDA